MIAVIFELSVRDGCLDDYLGLAGSLRDHLEQIDGFISVERFRSITNPEKLLSLSFFRDEAAVQAWRNLPAHRSAQQAGRRSIFADYRLRVAHVVRDYGMEEREGAPPDGRAANG